MYHEADYCAQGQAAGETSWAGSFCTMFLWGKPGNMFLFCFVLFPLALLMKQEGYLPVKNQSTFPLLGTQAIFLEVYLGFL